MLKNLAISLISLLILISCKREKKIIVSEKFADSLMQFYSPSAISKSMTADSLFWKKRIDPNSPGFVNEQKYAGILALRFRIYGDIQDLLQADSIIKRINHDYDGKEVVPLLMLTGYALSLHQFKEAEKYAYEAKKLRSEKYATQLVLFDVNFETGRYAEAERLIQPIKSNTEFDYFFRLAKLTHVKGSIDSAIAAMLKVADNSGSNEIRKQAAITNAADLNVHAGNLEKAYQLYLQSLKSNSTDFHSMMGVAWIALVNDKNPRLAEKIFRFVQNKFKSLDPLFKLAQVMQARGDSISAKAFAKQFVKQASAKAYGNMYNKYLIEVLTEILHEPAKAEAIARTELKNRSTPQTYAWYAWSLFLNNKSAEAFKVYRQYVSGQPLEGLELFYMGKMMKGLGKGYDARQYFKAAYENRYDLTPKMAAELEKNLE